MLYGGAVLRAFMEITDRIHALNVYGEKGGKRAKEAHS
jgi:hypothetical protein